MDQVSEGHHFLTSIFFFLTFKNKKACFGERWSSFVCLLFPASRGFLLCGFA